MVQRSWDMYLQPGLQMLLESMRYVNRKYVFFNQN